MRFTIGHRTHRHKSPLFGVYTSNNPVPHLIRVVADNRFERYNMCTHMRSRCYNAILSSRTARTCVIFDEEKNHCTHGVVKSKSLSHNITSNRPSAVHPLAVTPSSR